MLCTLNRIGSKCIVAYLAMSNCQQQVTGVLTVIGRGLNKYYALYGNFNHRKILFTVDLIGTLKEKCAPSPTRMHKSWPVPSFRCIEIRGRPYGAVCARLLVRTSYCACAIVAKHIQFNLNNGIRSFGSANASNACYLI